jgi:hypothetical protein
MPKFLFLISFFLLGKLVIARQIIKADSLIVAFAKKNAIATYSQSMSQQSHLFNGSAYIRYQSRTPEHPYLIDDWENGSLVYDGEYYENVDLLFDLSIDKLITEKSNGLATIQLVSEKIDRFSLGERQFVKFNDDTVEKGFYEILYSGSTKVYARRYKTFEERVEGGRVIKEFELKEVYYIKKNDLFFRVRNLKSVMNVFSDRKRELKSLHRFNSLLFKKDLSKNIARMAKSYDQVQE